MVAAGGSGLYSPFSAPPAPKNKLGQVQTPARKVDFTENRLLSHQQAIDACEIRFGARLMSCLFVSLSSQCHRF
jgi:hypothetical protein